MPVNPYESDRLLGEYLLFHYGKPAEILPYPFGPIAALEFPARVVSECVDVAVLPPDNRALDLGCAAGRSSFELARHCGEVVGVDFSQSFIRAASSLAGGGRIEYQRTDEGRLTTGCQAEVPSEIDRRRVRFEVGDACSLRGDIGVFDVAILVNLLDRLPEPRRCLDRLPSLIKRGGQLVIASPFTWLEEYTPAANWLGGYESDGHKVDGFTTVRELLDPHFEFIKQVDLPFLIREHARKFQWSVSLAGVWRRKS